MLKKILQWALIAFVVFYIVTQPTDAATVVKSGVNTLEFTANGFSQFLSQATL